MKKRSISQRFLPYRPNLTAIARTLRNNMTLSEVLLWEKLKNEQMLGYDFHRQRPVDEFIVDFFSPRLLLSIEIDGASHEGKLEKDNTRQADIERYGVRFLRFDDEVVKKDFDAVLEAIRDWIEINGTKNSMADQRT